MLEQLEQLLERMVGVEVDGFRGSGLWPEALFTCRCAEQCREEIGAALDRAVQLRRGADDEQVAFPVDLFVLALCEGRGSKWSRECTEKLLDLLLDLLDFERAHPLCTMKQSFEKFQQLLLRFSCERPPWTIQLFSQDQVEAIVKFVLREHYQHFAAHKHLTCETIEQLVLAL